MSRFGCASASLSLQSLLVRMRRGLWVGLVFAVAVHVCLGAWRGKAEQAQVAKPLTTQFVKRQPRLTKPLELKKRPQPKRRTIRRELVSVEARVERQRDREAFQPARVVRSLVRPRVAIGRTSEVAGTEFEPRSVAQAIESRRETEQKVDMCLELMDIEALDTGKYHAMVVQDPEDKRSIRGFCHLAIAELPRSAFAEGSFETYVLPGFMRLPLAMNEYTDIKADILGRLALDDSELFKVPWLLLCAHLSFELTDSQLMNLGEYLTSGGFMFADGHDSEYARWMKAGLTSLRNTLLDALETQAVDAVLERLPNSHAIYHCYFDFDGPPVGADAAEQNIHPGFCRVKPYLEGVEHNGSLLAVYSRKNYQHAWTFWGREAPWLDWDPKRPFQFAANTIIFALTQEGSVTHRLMESVAY